jgi:hypothetical protein
LTLPVAASTLFTSRAWHLRQLRYPPSQSILLTSPKWSILVCKMAQALFVAWYNFARKHEAVRSCTKAMASRLADHVWTIRELLVNAAAE